MSEQERNMDRNLNEEGVEQLTDELSELIESAADGHGDIDAINACLSALDDKSPLPFEIDAEAAFERFTAKHTAATEQQSTKKKSKVNIRRLAAVAAIAAVLICTTVAANQTNKNIFGVFAQWAGNTFTVGKEAPAAFIKETPLADGEEKWFDSLQEATDYFGITAPIAPQFVPDRFTLEEVSAKNQVGFVMISASYSGTDGYFAIQFRQSDGNDFTSVERESNDVQLFDCGGISHYLFTVGEREKAYWLNGELECTYTGSISRDESKKIIESIYK